MPFEKEIAIASDATSHHITSLHRWQLHLFFFHCVGSALACIVVSFQFYDYFKTVAQLPITDYNGCESKWQILVSLFAAVTIALVWLCLPGDVLIGCSNLKKLWAIAKKQWKFKNKFLTKQTKQLNLIFVTDYQVFYLIWFKLLRAVVTNLHATALLLQHNFCQLFKFKDYRLSKLIKEKELPTGNAETAQF